MTIRQMRASDMLKRVDHFGITHADEFPPRSTCGQLFAELRFALAELGDQQVAQASGRSRARHGTAAKANARDELWARLVAVGRTARALGIDTPGLGAAFRLPRRGGARGLLAAARAMATRARESSGRFVAYGLRASFVDDLNGAIERFERAIAAGAEGRRAHIAARGGIKAALAHAFSIVRRLDAVVTNVLADDAAGLERWRRARQVAPRRRTPKRGRPRRAAARLSVIQRHHEESMGSGGRRDVRVRLDADGSRG